jgi:hypothetical protein
MKSRPVVLWFSLVVLALVTSETRAAETRAPARPACTGEQMAELRAPATDRDWRVSLTCSPTLTSADVIEKEIQLEGAEADGVTLTCNGATLGDPAKSGRPRPDHRLVIRSARDPASGAWHGPRDVAVIGCRIAGTLRIAGFDEDAARESSRRPGHTERAQAAAPHGIRLERNRFVGDADLFKILIGVGVTDLEIVSSRFDGRLRGTTVYVGDEAARIRIAGNHFDAVSDRREQIAIDGAAHVTVERNVFADTGMGGIYIYRNCGERGRVRIQEPRFNRIEGNTFVPAVRRGKPRPIIWIGSRNKKRTERATECVLDDGAGFGSSLTQGQPPMTERDMARDNQVIGNNFVGIDPAVAIRDDDTSNVVSRNRTIAEPPPALRANP